MTERNEKKNEGPWGIWSEVYGGVTGHRQAWQKDIDGNVIRFETEADADAEATRLRRTVGLNSSATFNFTAQLID